MPVVQTLIVVPVITEPSRRGPIFCGCFWCASANGGNPQHGTDIRPQPTAHSPQEVEPYLAPFSPRASMMRVYHILEVQ